MAKETFTRTTSIDERVDKIVELLDEGFEVKELIDPEDEAALFIRMSKSFGYVVVGEYMQEPQFFRDWMELASCLGMPIEIFTLETGQSHSSLDVGRKICEGCPVKVDCLEDSLARRDYGFMRAGLVGQQLAKIRRLRRLANL